MRSEEPVDELQADVYSFIDQFTITNDEDLRKINHSKIVSGICDAKGSRKEKYKCKMCNNKSSFFSEAEKHHMFHNYHDYNDIRKSLKQIEIERANAAMGSRHVNISRTSQSWLCYNKPTTLS